MASSLLSYRLKTAYDQMTTLAGKRLKFTARVRTTGIMGMGFIAMTQGGFKKERGRPVRVWGPLKSS